MTKEKVYTKEEFAELMKMELESPHTLNEEHEKNIVKKLHGMMVGKFWFSKKQQIENSKKGYPRFYCIIEKEMKEYTEMVDFETLAEDPTNRCFYDDATYLGEGHYSHRTEQ